MNDLERLLATIGDLELSRRVLTERVQDLEKQIEELKANANGKVPERAEVIDA